VHFSLFLDRFCLFANFWACFVLLTFFVLIPHIFQGLVSASFQV
jgi:hypothetical protein